MFSSEHLWRFTQQTEEENFCSKEHTENKKDDNLQTKSKDAFKDLKKMYNTVASLNRVQDLVDELIKQKYVASWVQSNVDDICIQPSNSVTGEFDYNYHSGSTKHRQVCVCHFGVLESWKRCFGER